MKTPRIVNAVGHIDDALVSGATRAKAVKKNAWLKWGSIAACFAIMLMAAVVALPMLLDDGNTLPPSIDTTVNNDSEFIYEKGYFYNIDEGDFSTYVGGKVIAEDKIGNKISDVNLTAGWKDNKGEWESKTEALRGEVYAINGVSNDIAVALKFIDKGEAVTTTHYYVMMNPTADLSIIEEYVREPIAQNNPGDEMAGEIPE